MARRRRNNDDWIFDVAKLIGLVLGVGFLFPPFRDVMIALGVLFVICVVGGVFLLIVTVVIWKTLKGKQAAQSESFPDQFHRRSTLKPEQASSSSSFSVNISIPSVTPSSSEPALQLIEKLRTIDWFQFEKAIETIYWKLGYSVTRRGGANADGGIDLMIEKDGVKTAIQCKQWKSWNVGVKTIREFLGALTDAGIERGIFITLCGYTGDAKQLAQKHGIEIVNETDLVCLLEQTNARFDPDLIAALNDSRKFCPKCENEMVLRTATKGVGAGRQFWGCSSYPRCRFTMPL